MKKLALLAVLALAAGGVALAASINAPFFLDDAPADGAFPPSSGTASFVGVHNNTGADLLCTVTYKKANGVDRTPGVNTFILSANSSLSFRPIANDSTTEGSGAAVPNMALVAGDPPAGSVQISWSGGISDIQGRQASVRATGTTSDSSEYTLPAGQ